MATDMPFWEVFRSSTSAMLIVGDDGVYQDANEAACADLGRTRAEIVGQRPGLFTPPERQMEVACIWRLFRERRHLALKWSVRLGDGRVRRIPIVMVADMAGDGRHVIAHLQGSTAAGSLSPREQEITRMLATGRTGAEIARDLLLSPETVRTHIRNAMYAVGARTRAELVACAVRDRLFNLAVAAIGVGASLPT